MKHRKQEVAETGGKRETNQNGKSHVNVDRVKRLTGMSTKGVDWQSRLFIHHFLCSKAR